MGERLSNSDLKIGATLYDELGPIRIMTFADGYIMARRPRCMPFVIPVSTALRTLNPTPESEGE